MKQILALFLLSSATLQCMDNESKQDWTSKKELAQKYGYPAAHFLEIVTATPPDKIKDLKVKDDVIIKAASALYEVDEKKPSEKKNPFDNIFTPEQWDALEKAGVLLIIDKYRPDSLSTWYPIDGITEKTVPNVNRKKREYCYPTPKNKRFLNLIEPSKDRSGALYVLQQIEFMDKNVPLCDVVQELSIPLNATELATDKDKNAKLITLSYKSYSGKKETQLWRAQRNIKRGDFAFYLKSELASQIRVLNCKLLQEAPEFNTTRNSGMGIIEVLKKYNVPLSDFLEVIDNPSSVETAIPALLSKHIPANTIPNFIEEFAKIYEKPTSNVTNPEELQKQFVEKSHNLSHKAYTYSLKQVLNEIASTKKD